MAAGIIAGMAAGIIVGTDVAIIAGTDVGIIAAVVTEDLDAAILISVLDSADLITGFGNE